MNVNLQMQTKTNNLSKLKFFIIYKIVMSVLCFISSILIFALTIGFGLILLIIAAGASKLRDTHEFVSSIGYFSVFTIILMVLTILLFVLTIVLSVKYFKNKYNRKLDLIVCFLMTIVGILYFILFVDITMPMAILVGVLTIPIIVNIIMIIKE